MANTVQDHEQRIADLEAQLAELIEILGDIAYGPGRRPRPQLRVVAGNGVLRG